MTRTTVHGSAGRPWRTARGQSIIEYLVVAVALLGAVLAVRGLIEGKMDSLMQEVQAQLSARGGTADGLLQ